MEFIISRAQSLGIDTTDLSREQILSKTNYQNTKEQKLAYTRKYARKNVERRGEWRRAWREKNREKVNADARVYRTTKYKSDSSAVMLNRWRVTFWRFIATNGGWNSKYDFGCSPKEARDHIEKQFQDGMNWDNRGEVWHIDHIKPLRRFDLSDWGEAMIAFHYTNTRPRWAMENMKDQPAKYFGT